jgi:hypothetical protein
LDIINRAFLYNRLFAEDFDRQDSTNFNSVIRHYSLLSTLQFRNVIKKNENQRFVSWQIKITFLYEAIDLPLQIEGLKINAGYVWLPGGITKFNCVGNHALK